MYPALNKCASFTILNIWLVSASVKASGARVELDLESLNCGFPQTPYSILVSQLGAFNAAAGIRSFSFENKEELAGFLGQVSVPYLMFSWHSIRGTNAYRLFYLKYLLFGLLSFAEKQ